MKKTGDQYFDSEEFRNLLAQYEQAVDTHQPVFMDPDELTEIADYYQMSGFTDKANDAIALALSLSPGAVGPLTYKIHEALYNLDLPLARIYLEQIIDTSDPDYIYDKLEILIGEQRLDEADDYLNEVVKSLPDDERQDYIVDIASIFADYGLMEYAMKWIVRAKPEDAPDYKDLMARIFFGLGKYDDSERIWGELIDDDPFSKRYWNSLASAQYMKEDFTKSVESSEFAIAIDPEDPEGIIAKANGLYRLGNYEEAMKYYERCAALQPDDEFALLHQGTCLINLGQNERAIDVLHQAAEIAAEDSPYLCDIYQELAFALGEEKRYDEALDCIDKADETDCDHVQLLVVRGHVLLSAGKLKEAQGYFQQAVATSEDMSHTLMRIIVSLYDNKYVGTAYRMFKSFFRMVPKDFNEGHAYMALCCYDLKKYDEFLQHLQTACQRCPQECRIVLSHMFPSDVEPEKYFDFIKEKMK